MNSFGTEAAGLAPGQRADLWAFALPGEPSSRVLLHYLVAFRSGLSMNGEPLDGFALARPVQNVAAMGRALAIGRPLIRRHLAELGAAGAIHQQAAGVVAVAMVLRQRALRDDARRVRVPGWLLDIAGLESFDKLLAGRLRCSERARRVPSLRTLAKALGVPHQRVAAGLARLRARGLLDESQRETRRGSSGGAFVVVRRRLVPPGSGTKPDQHQSGLAVAPNRTSGTKPAHPLAPNLTTRWHQTGPAPEKHQRSVHPPNPQRWTIRIETADQHLQLNQDSPNTERAYVVLSELGIFARAAHMRVETAKRLCEALGYQPEDLVRLARIVGADPATRSPEGRFADALRHPERLSLLLRSPAPKPYPEPVAVRVAQPDPGPVPAATAVADMLRQIAPVLATPPAGGLGPVFGEDVAPTATAATEAPPTAPSAPRMRSREREESEIEERQRKLRAWREHIAARAAEGREH